MLAKLSCSCMSGFVCRCAVKGRAQLQRLVRHSCPAEALAASASALLAAGPDLRVRLLPCSAQPSCSSLPDCQSSAVGERVLIFSHTAEQFWLVLAWMSIFLQQRLESDILHCFWDGLMQQLDQHDVQACRICRASDSGFVSENACNKLALPSA